MGKGNEQGLVALVRQAIFTVLDKASPRTPGIAWDFNDDEQRVDFADQVVAWLWQTRDEIIEEVAKEIESAPLTYAGPDPHVASDLRYLIVCAIRDLKGKQ